MDSRGRTGEGDGWIGLVEGAARAGEGIGLDSAYCLCLQEGFGQIGNSGCLCLPSFFLFPEIFGATGGEDYCIRLTAN